MSRTLAPSEGSAKSTSNSQGLDRREVRSRATALELDGGGGPQERVRIETSPDLPGVELMVIARSVRRWRILHDTYTVCVVPEWANSPGRVDWWYRAQRHTAFSWHSVVQGARRGPRQRRGVGAA
jgi:hypothetical protein